MVDLHSSGRPGLSFTIPCHVGEHAAGPSMPSAFTEKPSKWLVADLSSRRITFFRQVKGDSVGATFLW